jgi:L,D-transpeptidase ErfK/SrfK
MATHTMGRHAGTGWRLFFLWLILIYGCSRQTDKHPSQAISETNDSLSTRIDSVVDATPKKTILQPIYARVKNTVRMKDYFFFIDSLADANFDSTSVLPEYVLVNANPWIIDSLRNLDYYHQQSKGHFVYDHSQQIIFHSGDRLLVPDRTVVAAIVNQLKTTRIDVNIPEYRLRVIQGNDTVLSCPVRIGRNADQYLEFYQREVDLRTPVGEGKIVTVRRKPKYIDLESGEEYVETNRDDGKRTKMPIMPSLQPSINGKFIGTLIHATTNPMSLGKAYSHGCIGTSEPDIWSIFYYCPPGTKVTFRYDLEIEGPDGKRVQLKDVYHLYGK